MSEEIAATEVETVAETTAEPGETLITPATAPVQVAEDGQANNARDGAPESYEDFTLPDGMKVDTDALEGFIPVARQLNLSQDKAQALIDYEAKRVEEFGISQDRAWDQMQNDWRTNAQSDKEIGGPAFDQSLAHAKTFLNAFGSPELIEALNTTGMGNHPEMIRALSRAGKAMSEDTLSQGRSSAISKKPEDILYPNQSEI